MLKPLVIRYAALSLACSTCTSAFPQSAHDHSSHMALGKVHFEPSCKAFESTLLADSECAIAYWGIAQSLLLNPFGPPPPKNLEEGSAAIEKAKAIGAETQRENDYVGAIGTFYANHDKSPHGVRLQAYLKATEDVALRYPSDDEAQIYYALALNNAASPNDKSYALPLKAAVLLELIFKRQPEHPGVAHYLVHSYDYPAIAEKGLDAAKRYAEIAGASPHALNMPSHIFTRVGYWKESIVSNTASARVAKQDKEPDDQLHAMDYMVYAYLQLGRDKEALAVLDEMKAVTGVNAARHTGPFALAASEARYAIERGDWQAAARLPLRPTRFNHVAAITHFTRALGSARTGRPDETKAEIARLAELRDKLRDAKDAYWSGQVDILWQVAVGWSLAAAGSHDDALKALSAAADAEDSTGKHVVAPGPLAPPRELYGFMLLERGMGSASLSRMATPDR